MSYPINNIVIVGGGSAGWLVASRLAAKYQADANTHIDICLIESDKIKPVGVGEGTWPTMRNTLREIGLSEREFITECDATFKQGSQFNGWVNGTANDTFYHPFDLPQGFATTNLLPHWQAIGQSTPFANAVNAQQHLCEVGLAPKQLSTPDYASVTNYGYHLNAGKFAQLLQKHTLSKFSVKHIKDDVIAISNRDNGDIASLITANHGQITGDLFIDCSGFASILLGKHLKVKFIDQNDILFADCAIALQVPYAELESPISCVTQSTATDAGWIWDIGLFHRRGIGHVYSSNHITESAAEQCLSQYLGGGNLDKFDLKKLPLRSGHRERVWKKNCVAVGLSAGFLEPLEASSLVQVELAIDWLCEQLPTNRTTMDIIAKRFNQAFEYRWAKIIDFLKLHYVLSQRQDSDFWLDNKATSSIPQSLQESLALWQHHFIWHNDSLHKHEIFGAASYQYILAGMGFKTNSPFATSAQEKQKAMALFNNNQADITKYLKHLPKHRDLLAQLRSDHP